MAKIVACPNCGHVFKLPLMDLKLSGLGFTIPFTGVVKCPECSKTAWRKNYKIASGSDAPVQESNASHASVTSQNDLSSEIEDSKYEDE